ncbi:MAG: arginine deiminase family protein [Pseudomonadota bacterium]
MTHTPFEFNSAIVRLPGRSVADGLRSNTGPAPVFEKVLAEHEGYVEALRAAAVQVTVLDALEQFPDSLFVEDPALVFSEAAILLRSGAPSREQEAETLSSVLAARFPRLLRLSRGHVDGGDILVTRDAVLIGLSARTDESGARELVTLLASIGFDGRIVHTPRGTLHLKSGCAVLDEETILVTGNLARSGIFDRWRTLIVPDDEPGAANALRINDHTLVRAECPRTADMLADHGFRVVALATAEIAKVDAGLSCMSLRWLE